MTKWHLIIDIAKCEDCNNCFLACKDEHVDNDWPGYTDSQPRHGHRWINIRRKERGQFPHIDVAYQPTPCMHCDAAPCRTGAGAGVVTKRDDGIVLIDPKKARGRKDLLKTCPYGAIWWNEKLRVPQKCTLCAHLLDNGWQQPRCVQVCPTGALKIIKADGDDMQRQIQNQQLAVLGPEHGTRPRVYYQNLYRFERCFIAGSVAVKTDDRLDCAKGATVVLIKEGRVVAEVKADSFGDYKFDDLPPDSGEYQLEVSYGDAAKKVFPVTVAGSVSLADIVV